MTKLEEEIKEAYDISHDVYGHELDEDELIKNVAEVAKRYIEKALIDGGSIVLKMLKADPSAPNELTFQYQRKEWLKENGVIE